MTTSPTPSSASATTTAATSGSLTAQQSAAHLRAHAAAQAAAGYVPSQHPQPTPAVVARHHHHHQAAAPISSSTSMSIGQGGTNGAVSHHGKSSTHGNGTTAVAATAKVSSSSNTTTTSTSMPRVIPSSSLNATTTKTSNPMNPSSSGAGAGAGAMGATTSLSATTNGGGVPTSSSSSSSIQNHEATTTISKPKEYMWQLNLQQVQQWIESIHVLIPKKPLLRIDAVTNKPFIPGTIRGNVRAYEIQQQHLQTKEQTQYENDSKIGSILLSNLIRALESASMKTSHTNDQKHHAKKRQKTNTDNNSTTTSTTTKDNQQQQGDLYNILDPSFASGQNIKHKPGAILSRLTLGSLINALAGQIGGVVDVLTCQPLPTKVQQEVQEQYYLHQQQQQQHGQVVLPQGGNIITIIENVTTPIPTAANQTIEQIQNQYLQNKLSKSIYARLEMDKLNSTPERIIEMLCPELTMQEVNSIRRRIYDTVILGRGTGSSAAVAERIDGGDEDPVLGKVGDSKQEFKKCGGCGNNDQSKFVSDQKNGDLICRNCGTIVEESLMHEGSQFRKFEGELDRNHHGDAPNPMFSNAYNMGTSLGGMGFVTGAGMGGYGSQGAKGMENALRNAHAYIEMNMSQFGKDERRTRIGYKDKQKRSAIVEMKHVGDALSLHQAVLERAKELFAGFRDDRELVQQLQGVLAACLCEAFDQLSNDGRQILKMKTGEEDVKQDEEETMIGKSKNGKNKPPPIVQRTNLHKTALVRKGGDGNDTSGGVKTKNAGSTLSEMEKKSASQWTLDDTRSWLLQASQNIATQWAKENSEELKNDKDTKKSNIPQGSKEELQGKLVGYTLTLCNQMEEELKKDMDKNKLVAGRQRVKTPRADMGHLGIKWQHAHERGSGGAGGVGNSGNGKYLGKPSKTAGQILMLKSAKKRLGEVINDQVAGEAFQREVQGLLRRQKAFADKQRSEETVKRKMGKRRRR